jgi:hypothetical protein
MMTDYYDQVHPFVPGVMVGPQEAHRLPANLGPGGAEESRFHFNLCNYMNGPTDSMTVASSFARLHERFPELFDPWLVAKMTYTDVSQRLIAAKIGFRSSTTEVPTAWVINSQLLVQDWEGDPRNIVQAAHEDWRELHRLLIRTKTGGFFGFGPKMASMLPFFLMRNNLVPYFLVPPQVDFHVMRVFWATHLVMPAECDGQEILRLEGHQIDGFADAIRLELEYYLAQTNPSQNWLDLSEALWTQSRQMCRLSPSNATRKDEEGQVWRDPIKWTDNQRKRHRRSCGRCSIAAHCTGSVPAGYYYDRARKVLWLLDREVPPPEENQLFNPD